MYFEVLRLLGNEIGSPQEENPAHPDEPDQLPPVSMVDPLEALAAGAQLVVSW